MTREIPHSPVALHEVAHLFGALVAETILASVHVRAHKQAGHMDAGDLIKKHCKTPCKEGGPSTYGKCRLNMFHFYLGADDNAKVNGNGKILRIRPSKIFS